MADQHLRIVRHWYAEEFPYGTDTESIERLNSVVPNTWEYLISHGETEPGIYLAEYVGELGDD